MGTKDTTESLILTYNSTREKHKFSDLILDG